MSIVEGKEGWFFIFFLFLKKGGGGREVVWRVEAGVGVWCGHRCYLRSGSCSGQEPLG